MKKTSLSLIIVTVLFYEASAVQQNTDYTNIDLMLARGEFKSVIDTCNQILAADSLNAEIYYKMGLACQNLLPDDRSFGCFLTAASIEPDNKLYKYMVAKGYYGKGKYTRAEPLFQSLCLLDSMNWSYAWYLTSIYMQEGKYDKSIGIYRRFFDKDTANYLFADKIGFALLRKGDYPEAIDLFNKSLAINNKNINALKNVAYLYSNSYRIDTAVLLLTRAIEIDTTDTDLYIRRASLYYSIDYDIPALNDYLKILASGDSSFLYLKRAGISYFNISKPDTAITFLLLAYNQDSTDYENLDYLARCYHKIKNLKQSAFYYSKIITMLSPFNALLGIKYTMLAEELKSSGLYKEAIKNYLKAQKIKPDPNIYMIIGNIYDNNLKNNSRAIFYYKAFLECYKTGTTKFTPDYIRAVRERMGYLKQKEAEKVRT